MISARLSGLLRGIFFPLAGLMALAASTLSQAQDDSAFLECAEYTDRGQRIACLEDALEAAAAEQPADTGPPPAPLRSSDTVPTPAEPPPRPERPETADAGADENRVSEFGREPRVEENEEGKEELHDTVAELREARPTQWLITLESGQSWFQVYPDRYNLRKGDAVRIYPADWGDNYRLETERLSGFIQVRRVE